ncbi:MAG TPA: DMT family transporter [Terriglobia bacterium]|nr:DMT family transporter [Terriglobia bacterium]
MAVFFGLLGAFSWAGADFLAGHVSRLIGPVRTFILAQCVGLGALTTYLVVARDPRWNLALTFSGPARRADEWALVAAILNIVGSMFLYHAFAIGKMALVTPIAASYPGVTVLLALASGEQLKASSSVGIPVILAGIMLTVIPVAGAPAHTAEAVPRGAHPDHAGVGWALGAALSFGVGFWVLGFHVTPTLGGVAPIWIIRLTGAALILCLVVRRNSPPLLPPVNIARPLAASALLDTVGFVATTLGLATGHVAVVTVLTSLFGVMIILLSWVMLKERLHVRQWCGVALIFAGVALVSV